MELSKYADTSRCPTLPSKRINTYMEEYKSINSNDHNKMVEICLKLRDYFDHTADYLNNEVDVYNAFYNNWVLGVQKSYDNIYYSFLFMEKGIPYALKLVNEFDKEKYKNIVYRIKYILI